MNGILFNKLKFIYDMEIAQDDSQSMTIDCMCPLVQNKNDLSFKIGKFSATLLRIVDETLKQTLEDEILPLLYLYVESSTSAAQQ